MVQFDDGSSHLFALWTTPICTRRRKGWKDAGQILKLDSNGRATAAAGQPGKALGEFGEAHYITLGPQDETWMGDTVKRTCASS